MAKSKDTMLIPHNVIRVAYAERIAADNRDNPERELAARSIFSVLPENTDAAKRMLGYAMECVEAYDRDLSQTLKRRSRAIA